LASIGAGFLPEGAGCTIAPIAAGTAGAKDGPVIASSLKAERLRWPRAGAPPVHDRRVRSDGPAVELESREWVQALSGTGSEREDAVERLHALLLQAARFEVNRRRRLGAWTSTVDADDLATQAADDALVPVIRKLHPYRGDSRFTTWAYKFALIEAAVKLRTRSWHDREIPLEAEAWARIRDTRTSLAGQAEALELIDAVRDAIADVLTPHQTAVLLALTLNDVPIDVLAERRRTTRGALYKTLHDARRKLRTRLAEDGLAVGGAA
jgi:RNA polymerase sigma-70 factor, ECF subfamily